MTTTGNASQLASVEFQIEPKPGSVSKAIDVRYSKQALVARGYLYEPDSPYGSDGAFPVIALPVYGLYANFENQVSISIWYQDGSKQSLPLSISTAPYVDPTGIYSKPTIRVARSAGTSLGFDYFYIKSGMGSPIIIDTDAEIRWVVPETRGSLSTYLDGDQFLIGDGFSEVLHVLRLDGTELQKVLASPYYTDFHHNIDKGQDGFLAEFDAKNGAVDSVESNIAEIDATGDILSEWDLAGIISDYMKSQGDDPTAFVRPGVDWFHSNSATYDPRDDSIIVSSRENFLIKLDYATGQILWIFGDPTKYWYTFPSLRAKALILSGGGLYPVGQHAVSITSDGYIMVFNDGDGSADQPAGQSPGISRSYSAVSAYDIDQATMTAKDVFDFDYGQSIYSAVCSSAYEANDKSILIDYAVADNSTESRLVGIDGAQNVVFDFQYPTTPCVTAWNSVPIALDNFSIE